MGTVGFSPDGRGRTAFAACYGCRALPNWARQRGGRPQDAYVAGSRPSLLPGRRFAGPHAAQCGSAGSPGAECPGNGSSARWRRTRSFRAVSMSSSAGVSKSTKFRRTLCTCRGAASSTARRPAGSRMITALRPSAGLGSRATSPCFCRPRTRWESRLFSHYSLGVSTSGCYEWKTRAPSARAVRHAWLTGLIGQAPRGLLRHLRPAQGPGRAAARARHHGQPQNGGAADAAGRDLRAAAAPQGQRVPAQKTVTGLVKRQFTADGPNRLRVTDVTGHPTREGKAYRCVVTGVFSRRVVG